MSDKGKCDWCGLVFDYQIRKPKLFIKALNEYLCDDCAKEFKRNEINIR
jgi:hypothetical protein